MQRDCDAGKALCDRHLVAVFLERGRHSFGVA